MQEVWKLPTKDSEKNTVNIATFDDTVVSALIVSFICHHGGAKTTGRTSSIARVVKLFFASLVVYCSALQYCTVLC
jgi:hypothetical protein